MPLVWAAFGETPGGRQILVARSLDPPTRKGLSLGKAFLFGGFMGLFSGFLFIPVGCLLGHALESGMKWAFQAQGIVAALIALLFFSKYLRDARPHAARVKEWRGKSACRRCGVAV